MSNALKSVNYNNASVSTQLPGQVKNSGGGFVFALDDVSRLERFLILGVDGGTYYVSEKDLTSQNVSWLQGFISRSADTVLDVVLDVSTSGRAYRNGPAIFVLALVLNSDNPDAKNRVVEIAPKVARTATMVYDLAQYIENLGGWGRAKRRAIANWFTSKTPDELAYQAVKYRQRNGWTLRDLMRLSHPVGVDKAVGNFILGREMDWVGVPILNGFAAMQRSQTVGDVLAQLSAYPNLPWETIPTQFLKDPEVWKTLFYNGSLTGQALVRNVVRLSKNETFSDIRFAGDYAKRLVDEEMIRKTRLHPIQYLMASVTYDEGQMSRDGYGLRTKDWTTNAKISGALHDGFYKAFKYSEKSDDRIRIGVDVSGSMSWANAIGSDLTAAQGAGAMALVLANQNDYVEILGFANTLRDLHIAPTDSFSTAFKKVQMNNFGYTDPGLLINDAANRNIKVDTFVVITDNEVNYGTQPASALKDYRKKMGIDAKLVVMAMTSTGFTIADPNDRGMLDVVGFDANVPKVITDFMNGKI